MVEKGLISFIRQKLEHSVDPLSIKHTLMRAGFTEKRIDAAFEHVRKTDPEEHRKSIELNEFLPPLKKDRDKKFDVEMPSQAHVDYVIHHENIHMEKGLFHGRLRRKDFILGFLFFFGLGYIALMFAGVFVSVIFPELWAAILAAVEADNQGLLLLVIPLLLFPITIMFFSLIVRRLHNLGIPGGVSLVFLVLCISPASIMSFYGLWILYGAVLLLFIILMTKKGDPAPNEYGALPGSRGSFFRRIFNV